jgi:hypothetical protein
MTILYHDDVGVEISTKEVAGILYDNALDIHHGAQHGIQHRGTVFCSTVSSTEEQSIP